MRNLILYIASSAVAFGQCGTPVWNPITNEFNCSGPASTATTPGTPVNSIQFNNPLGTFAGNANLIFNATALATPAAPTLTVHCTVAGMETCSTERDYVVVAYNQVGRTDPSATATTLVGPDTLSVTNYVAVATASLTGSTYCDVIQQFGQGLIGQPLCGATLNDTGQTGSGRSDQTFVSGNYTQGLALGYDGFSAPLPVDGIDAIHVGTPLSSFHPFVQSNAWYIAPIVIGYKGPFINGHSPVYIVSENNVTNGFSSGPLTVEGAASGASTDNLQVMVGIGDNFGSGTVPLMEVFSAVTQFDNTGTVGVTTTAELYNARNPQGASGNVVNYIGFHCEDFTKATTFMACASSDLSAGAGKWAFYGSGTAASHFGGVIDSPLYATTTKCANAASPAVCAAAPAGAVAIPTGITTVSLVVNTTAVTASSQIKLQADDSLTIAATTCNNTLATLVGGLAVTARTPGTSFTITYNGTIATNPLCISYTIIN